MRADTLHEFADRVRHAFADGCDLGFVEGLRASGLSRHEAEAMAREHARPLGNVDVVYADDGDNVVDLFGRDER